MTDLTPIFNAVIALVAALVSAFVIPWVKRNTTAQEREDFLRWVEIAVAAAEQLFHATQGAEKKKYVIAFLEEKGFEFGFATYWNANIMTELTDGRVEIANIQDPESLEYFKWSSPVKYYQEDYHQGPVFLLLTTEEATEYGKAKVLRAGEKLYEDDHYVVYLYGSREELMSHAEER